MDDRDVVKRLIKESQQANKALRLKRALDERIQLGMLLFSAIGFIFVLRYL